MKSPWTTTIQLGSSTALPPSISFWADLTPKTGASAIPLFSGFKGLAAESRVFRR